MLARAFFIVFLKNICTIAKKSVTLRAKLKN